MCMSFSYFLIWHSSQSFALYSCAAISYANVLTVGSIKVFYSVVFVPDDMKVVFTGSLGIFVTSQVALHCARFHSFPKMVQANAIKD